jgi:hypothetical protein
MKTTATNKSQKAAAGVVDKKMKDHGKAPLFVKKTEEANAYIRQHGLPKELVKK